MTQGSPYAASPIEQSCQPLSCDLRSATPALQSESEPETWPELLEAVRRVNALGGGVAGYGANAGERYVLFKKFMPFAWGNGGRILTDDLKQAVFDSPENREALAFYISLRKVGMMERQDVLDRAFKSGTLGLEISGAWLCKSMPKDAPGLRYGVALVPRPS